jgi:hypothetical protein
VPGGASNCRLDGRAAPSDKRPPEGRTWAPAPVSAFWTAERVLGTTMRPELVLATLSPQPPLHHLGLVSDASSPSLVLLLAGSSGGWAQPVPAQPGARTSAPTQTEPMMGQSTTHPERARDRSPEHAGPVGNARRSRQLLVLGRRHRDHHRDGLGRTALFPADSRLAATREARSPSPDLTGRARRTRRSHASDTGFRRMLGRRV